MQLNPFSLFEQFSDDLKIAIFDKSDDGSEQGIATALGTNLFASAEQVHGNQTAVVQTPTLAKEVDGLATTTPEMALIIRWADCQNFVFYEPKRRVASVLHVGWRGLIAGAITEHLKILENEWEILPEEVFVGAGPSLCWQHARFSDPKNELPNVSSRFLRNGHVNLQAVADNEFDTLGVPANQRERNPDCPYCLQNKYWTYRGGDHEAVKNGARNLLACVLR